MGTSFSPYLHFHGNAAEAMATYGAIFGGSPDIVTFGQFGGADPAIAGQVMHSSLRAGPGLLIMASDTPSEMGGGYDVAGNTSVAVISDGADPADDATLTGWWDALSDGATIIAPLAEAPWGASSACSPTASACGGCSTSQPSAPEWTQGPARPDDPARVVAPG